MVCLMGYWFWPCFTHNCTQLGRPARCFFLQPYVQHCNDYFYDNYTDYQWMIIIHVCCHEQIYVVNNLHSWSKKTHWPHANKYWSSAHTNLHTCTCMHTCMHLSNDSTKHTWTSYTQQHTHVCTQTHTHAYTCHMTVLNTHEHHWSYTQRHTHVCMQTHTSTWCTPKQLRKDETNDSVQQIILTCRAQYSAGCSVPHSQWCMLANTGQNRHARTPISKASHQPSCNQQHR